MIRYPNILKGPTDKDTKKFKQQKPITGEEYELSRFKPALKNVIEVILISVVGSWIS